MTRATGQESGVEFVSELSLQADQAAADLVVPTTVPLVPDYRHVAFKPDFVTAAEEVGHPGAGSPLWISLVRAYIVYWARGRDSRYAVNRRNRGFPFTFEVTPESNKRQTDPDLYDGIGVLSLHQLITDIEREAEERGNVMSALVHVAPKGMGVVGYQVGKRVIRNVILGQDRRDSA